MTETNGNGKKQPCSWVGIHKSDLICKRLHIVDRASGKVLDLKGVPVAEAVEKMGDVLRKYDDDMGNFLGCWSIIAIWVVVLVNVHMGVWL